MMTMIRLPILALLAALICAGHPAMAAESYDNCTGFIESLPATISTQGTWCLRKDLSTAMTSGNAVTVATNNVTIDCNDFKIGGLAAGPSTDAFGIFADVDRLNTNVRNCNVRGFWAGIMLNGSGHVVEGNRLDGNTYAGIYTSGDGNIVRGNTVRDTGGRPATTFAIGISAYGSSSLVVDNYIVGVSPMGSNLGQGALGIAINTGTVQNNRIADLVAPTGGALGISIDRGFAVGNRILQSVATQGNGIQGDGNTQAVCRDNDIAGYSAAIFNCLQAGTNTFLP